MAIVVLCAEHGRWPTVIRHTARTVREGSGGFCVNVGITEGVFHSLEQDKVLISNFLILEKENIFFLKKKGKSVVIR